jgi:hypothetical protein
MSSKSPASNALLSVDAFTTAIEKLSVFLASKVACEPALIVNAPLFIVTMCCLLTLTFLPACSATQSLGHA